MAPSTRSSIKFQQTASGERRVIEGGESRKLTTEEMNDFATRHSSLKPELEGVRQEAKEKEKRLKKLGALLEQMRQAEPHKETIADKDVGEGMSAVSMEAAMDQKLTPLTELLSRLTRKVEQISEGNSVADVAYGRE
jgi:paraquat-inducible protein B